MDWQQEWQQGSRVRAERRLDRVRDLVSHRREEVLVGIHRERDGGVSEGLGDYLRVDVGHE
jgi:hypothetical protein